MPEVVLTVNDAQIGQARRRRRAALTRESKAWDSLGDSIGRIQKDQSDGLGRLARDSVMAAKGIGKLDNSIDAVLKEIRATAKSTTSAAKGIRSQGRASEDAATKLTRLAKQQELTNRLMRENSVSARAAGAAVRAFGKDLDLAGKEAAGYAVRLDRAQKETRQLSAAQGTGTGLTRALGGAVKSAAVAVVGLAAAYFGAQAAIRAVNALIRGSITAFADLQDAVVSLRKVTDGLGDEGLKNLVGRLEDLSSGAIPIATEQLIELAAVAGQLGIETEAGLANAAATGAKLAAATDLAAASAIKSLARLLSIQGESIGSIDNLGAALVELGNTSRATESEIEPIANEIARATANFDIATPTILGFSAALAEMGAKAEGSGSAISELFQAILRAKVSGEGLDDLARIAGVSADELREMAASDLSGAVVQFLQGLGTFGEEGALALESVGLSSKRTAKALLPLAANAERLADRISVSNKAFQENTALNKEAAAAFSTLRSDAQRVENAFKLLLAKGVTPLAKPMSQMLKDLAGLITAWTKLGEGLSEIPAISVTVGVALQVLTDRITAPIEMLERLPRLLAVLAGVELGRIAAGLEGVAGLIPLGGGAPLLQLATDLKGLEKTFLELAVATFESEESHEDLAESFDKTSTAGIGVKATVEAVDTALGNLQAQVIHQENVNAAMVALSVTSAEASLVVGTLTDIESEAGASALEAAENVAALLGLDESAAVDAVAGHPARDRPRGTHAHGAQGRPQLSPSHQRFGLHRAELRDHAAGLPAPLPLGRPGDLLAQGLEAGQGPDGAVRLRAQPRARTPAQDLRLPRRGPRPGPEPPPG